MCTQYRPTGREVFEGKYLAEIREGDTWRGEVFQDYLAPIIVPGDGARKAMMATYGFVPKRHLPPGKKMTTLNARSEDVAQRRTYAGAWKKSQLCLVPMQDFFEPNWEGEKHVRWSIGMANAEPFAVAGLWRTWVEPDQTETHSFTQLTINADEHPLMNRFHRPGEEKRSLVIVRPEEYDDWLGCHDAELARSFMRPFPAELMTAAPSPPPPRMKAAAPPAPPTTPDLFD